MDITVRAVYEGGVLRPAQQLKLEEGENVELTVSRTKSALPRHNEDESARKLKAAKSITEWVEATKQLPADDGGYDILHALNENRIWSGEQALYPKEAS